MRYTAKTWCWQDDLAMWSFRVPLLKGENAHEGMKRCFAGIVSHIDTFGKIEQLSLTTVADGEDAVVIDGVLLADKIDVDTILNAGVVGVSAVLGLWVRTEVNQEREQLLRAAGQLLLEFADSLDEDDGRAVDVTISIDVDLYSPVTWGEERDNGALAKINGPRLRSFLMFIRDELRGKLILLDADSYSGLVDEAGFRPAAEALTP